MAIGQTDTAARFVGLDATSIWIMKVPSIPIHDMKYCVFLMFEPNGQAWILTISGDWLKVHVEAEE